MLIGKRLGPFLVQKQLGRGAMGSVFGAVHEKTGQRVALKMIAVSLIGNRTAMNRFQRESAILKQMNHPNISRYIGSGRVDGTPFYVMEFVEGESLDHVLERRGKISWEEVAGIGKQLCAALQHAHSLGIIHRDLKPSNVMVQKDGSVKLTDFGIAKDTDVTALTAANSTLGTAAYMSPEQCRGSKELTGKADLYSMGILFFELLTGQKPFIADNTMDMFLKHTNEPIPRASGLALDLPVWFDTLVYQLMEKNPDHRPYDADKVARALAEIEEKVIAQKSAGIDRASKRRADKTSLDGKLDADDKAAARELLGKRKKKKHVPFYTKAWFTISALAVILGALAYGGWWLFIKIPSPESLHAEVKTIMEGKALDDWRPARPLIDLFWKHYREHELSRDMLAWRDKIERESCETYLRKNLLKEGRDPAEVKQAYKDELAGNLESAERLWSQVVPLKESDDFEKRGWGLTAEAHRQPIVKALAFAKEVRRKLEREDEIATNSEAEAAAVAALKFEFEKKPDDAAKSWDQVRRLAGDAPEQRYLHLLAQRTR